MMAVRTRSQIAAGGRVVGQTQGHEQRAQVGVAEAQRTVVVRVLRDGLGGIAGVVDQDLHGGDDHGDRVPVGGNVEAARRGDELHQVEAGQVAGRVVEEHVLRAGIGRVDARRVLAGVPLVDGGVELHAGIAAEPGGLGDLAHDVARLVGLYRLVALDGVGGEVAVALVGAHELVADADGVVGVLEEDGGIGLGIGAGAVVAGLDQREGLGFFLGLALDEVHDVGMVDVEDDHLGRAARLAAGLDDAGKGVEAAHEAQAGRRPGRRPKQSPVSRGSRRDWCPCPIPT